MTDRQRREALRVLYLARPVLLKNARRYLHAHRGENRAAQETFDAAAALFEGVDFDGEAVQQMAEALQRAGVETEKFRASPHQPDGTAAEDGVLYRGDGRIVGVSGGEGHE